MPERACHCIGVCVCVGCQWRVGTLVGRVRRPRSFCQVPAAHAYTDLDVLLATLEFREDAGVLGVWAYGSLSEMEFSVLAVCLFYFRRR